MKLLFLFNIYDKMQQFLQNVKVNVTNAEA